MARTKKFDMVRINGVIFRADIPKSLKKDLGIRV